MGELDKDEEELVDEDIEDDDGLEDGFALHWNRGAIHLQTS